MYGRSAVRPKKSGRNNEVAVTRGSTVVCITSVMARWRRAGVEGIEALLLMEERSLKRG